MEVLHEITSIVFAYCRTYFPGANRRTVVLSWPVVPIFSNEMHTGKKSGKGSSLKVTGLKTVTELTGEPIAKISFGRLFSSASCGKNREINLPLKKGGRGDVISSIFMCW
jgi:hypothetical protein